MAKLIGSPPGYVGYDEESQLTDPVPWIVWINLDMGDTEIP